MLLAGCGSDKDGKGATAGTTAAAPAEAPVHWTLVLDYQPNAVHAGLLQAQRAGYFKAAGIDLKIVAPSSTSDALTQVTRGRADLGLADLIDVARRNERAEAKSQTDGRQIVSLAGAIVQRPLSGLLVNADSGITDPTQLQGKKIAVTGLPSDTAVVNAIVRKDGKPLPVKTITLGFDGINALHAGRVDASTAYWPADAVTLEQLGTKARTFALDQFGGPAYPGLVAFSTLTTRMNDPEHVAAFSAALAHGTRDVIANPQVGIDAVQKSYPELDAAITKKQLANYEPLFGTATTAGQLDPKALNAFTAFAASSKLTSKRLSVSELDAIPQVTATDAPATTAP
ncbi:MAG: ABC transporter substrate-binding protein [Solirubrobacteraceae bacterium]|nr:ABC transporter substrate-binding protein [Patulibacter sp.]